MRAVTPPSTPVWPAAVPPDVDTTLVGRDQVIAEVTDGLVRGEPRVVEAHKAASVEWFPLAALPEPMVPHEAYALAQLSSGAAYLTFGF